MIQITHLIKFQRPFLFSISRHCQNSVNRDFTSFSKFSAISDSTSIVSSLKKLSSCAYRLGPISFDYSFRQIRFFADQSTDKKISKPKSPNKKMEMLEIEQVEMELRKRITIMDGLNPDEWTLIYFNKIADRAVWFLWPLLVLGSIISAIFAAFMPVQLFARYYMNQMEKKHILAACFGTGLGLSMNYMFLRWRFYLVFRMYRRKSGDISKKSTTTTTEKNLREYCIVWFGFLRQRRRFFYNHTETNGANEKWPKLMVLPPASFYAKNRPWYVRSDMFVVKDEYFLSRVSKD